VLLSASLILGVHPTVSGQTITSSLPTEIDSSRSYLFYLHGGIVQDEGIDAVSEYYGAYKYLDILDSLTGRGFHVISERRPKGTLEEEYAEKVMRQIDTLLSNGVSPERILVLGASQGAAITIEAAYRMKSQLIKYVVMGLCSDYWLGYFSKYKDELCGNFLSIYERTDVKGSCDSLFLNLKCKSGYREVALSMGNSHAFLYRPYTEWIEAIMDWQVSRKTTN